MGREAHEAEFLMGHEAHEAEFLMGHEAHEAEFLMGHEAQRRFGCLIVRQTFQQSRMEI